MMKKLFDLRFVIGLFFFAVGTILIIGSFIISFGKENGNAINLYSGIVFAVFGSAMLILSFFNSHKQ